jgi:UDP-glucose 4-epimerase
MKNLILGSSGFLGKRLCNFLIERGEEVVEFDIKNNKSQDARTSKLPLEDIDRVFFLVWDVGGSKYLYKKDSQAFQMKWNNDIMNNIFPQLEDIPFVFTSSQLSHNVDTVYGSQKRLGEVWAKLTKKGVSVRLWNLYGYIEELTERSHVVSDFVYQAVNNDTIKMITKGDEVRQFIHIDDVCSGLIKSFDVEDNSKTYDISSGEWVKLLHLANIISEETKCKVNPGEKSGESLLIDNKEFIPNWHPKVSLNDGIKRMVNSFDKQI